MKKIKIKSIAIFQIIILICLVVFWSFFRPQFDTNDDTGLLNYISGYQTGHPEILPYVMSVPYTFIVSSLYFLFSGIPWYTVCFIFLLTISFMLVAYASYKLSDGNIYAILFFVALTISIYSHVLYNIQFTTVAAMCGAASIVALLLYEKTVQIRFATLSVILLFFSVNIRYQVGCVALVILFLLCSGYCFIDKKKNIIIFMLVSFFVMIASVSANNIYINYNSEWRVYSELQNERSRWIDFSHLPYESNEDVYNSVGWDASLYNLASRYLGCEENLNLEAYKKINSEKTEVKIPLSEKIISAFYTVFSHRKSIIVLSIWFIVLLYSAIELLNKKRNETCSIKKTVLFFISIAIFIFYCILLFYFCYIQRIPKRIEYFIQILTVTPAFLLNICVLKDQRVRNNKHFLIKKAIYYLMIAMISIFGIKTLMKIEKEEYHSINSFYNYVNSNPSNFYLYDTTATWVSDPFKTLDRMPVNACFWGGWLWDSPLSKKQLKINGMDNCYLATMLEENKFFIGSQDNADLLLNYYAKRFNNVNFKKVFEGDGWIVYCFRIDN